MTIMVAEAGLSPREYSPILQVGVVSGQSDNKRFMVVVGREEISAMLAVSCLVKPEEGDTVAVYNVEGMGYVLGLVLERASSGCVDITIDGEVRIESTGALSLKSLEEVSISAKGKIEMLSERFEVFSEELKVRGKRLISTFESVNLSVTNPREVFCRDHIRKNAHLPLLHAEIAQKRTMTLKTCRP